MKQFELAQALGISTGMVSRLVKRGMPTDSVERAQRWRKRHLEPGRVKGSRFDPNAPATVPQNEPKLGGEGVTAARVEAIAVSLLPRVEQAGEFLERAALLEPLRAVLRALPDCVEPRMPGVMWAALLEYAVLDELLHAVRGAFTDPVSSAGVLDHFHQHLPHVERFPEAPIDLAADRWRVAQNDPALYVEDEALVG